MKFIGLIVLVLTAVLFYAFRSRFQSPPAPTSGKDIAFYDLKVAGLEGDTIRMADFRGKYVMIVNVASRCGHTPQYKDLQALYEKMGDKLVIVGFPCNQFLFQEPGDAAQIAEFCERNYGVTFPMTEKIDVKGSKQHPVYQWLTQKRQNGVSDAEVSWNFQKFLISPEGKWIASFEPKTPPLSDKIVSLIV